MFPILTFTHLILVDTADIFVQSIVNGYGNGLVSELYNKYELGDVIFI